MLLKQLFILVLLALFLSGCSNNEKVVELTQDLDEMSERLEEKESELKALYQQLEETKEQEYIKIPKNEAPKLWSNPDAQIWENVLNFSFAEENGWKRGSTNWRKWDGEFDPSLSAPNQSWETPGLLMLAWMTDVEATYWLGQEVWEINTRIEFSDESSAKGYILSFGFFDDSIDGSDIKITMKKENGFWYIVDVEERSRCSRGLSEDDELCL
ncbi:hypothetical protein IMZ08_18045 [Bacillus luteolus]|uniref:Uncharacterized protein n=1 Tax=Litchfieldia luteola TaxID=682179 RepID=A0ABR9QN54_9BACI|nr:hypothetical protein [Cytobacillus luteolus]MBE4909941.1 hypothetical protein [Cytobacillus luteolus]MBP1942503.1 outer membrane murein-binding lipoprotein Lpp [Cytobacillus luteolus]